MQHKTYFELIDLIEQQSVVISKQGDMIAQLLNDNAEKENFISELIRNDIE